MPRSKIAITIKDDLLHRLDRAIDGETIRNRSHAIEYFLDKALGAKVEKALLIGGYKDFSLNMLFEGKPIIERQLELLQKRGVKEVLLWLHENEKGLQKLVGDGSKYGLRILYQWQTSEHVGTAYITSVARKFFGEDSFFVLYGDVVTDIDLADFAAYHEETNSVATVALTSIQDPSLYGSVQMRGKKIVGFTEKPKEKEVSRVISAGMFCVSPEIFEYIPKGKAASLEQDVFPRLAAEGKLAGYVFEGSWCNVRNKLCLPPKK